MLYTEYSIALHLFSEIILNDIGVSAKQSFLWIWRLVIHIVQTLAPVAKYQHHIGVIQTHK